MIELRALGGLRLRDSADGREILSVLARSKPPGVLVYLALSPADASHGRDELLELLWPDSNAKKARSSLSQALHILRRGLGPHVIGATGEDELFLETGAVWSDVAAFDEALAAGHEREALELYRGHLWDGSDFSDCPAFERWLEGERQRLRLKAVEAATTLAQELERDGGFVDAAKWLRHARAWAPFDETVVRLLLKLLHRLGERAAAVNGVTAGLTHTSFVEVVTLGTRLLPHEAVPAVAGSMERSGRLQALARANGTGTVVWGSYYLQGDSLHFLAHVTNAATGEELATIESVRGPVDDPVAAVEQLRDRMMTTLVTLTDPRLAKWMRYASKPSTFEVFTEFVHGIDLYGNEKSDEAIPYFLRAAALDSDFTMASLWAALAYLNSGQRAPADSLAQALNRRRGQLAPVDGLFLDYQLVIHRRDIDGTRDSHGILEAMRQVVEIAPGSEFLHQAGWAAFNDGRLPEAIEFFTRIDPDDGWLGGRVSYLLTWTYHRLGDHERELEALNRLRQLDPESDRTLRAGMRALAASGRIEELEFSILEAVQRDPWSTGFSWFGELRAHGYPAEAAAAADRTLEWFEGRTTDWRQDPGQAYVYAKLLSEAGRWDESQAILEDVLKTARFGSKRVNTALALADVLAMQGQREQAYSAVGLTAYSSELRVRASVEAALGERERALELLQKDGYRPEIYEDPHFLPEDSMKDYPPYQEFIRPRG